MSSPSGGTTGKRKATVADKSWKADERKVARFFGTVRNPLSGINSRHTGSDTLDKDLFIENKRRKAHAMMTLLRDTAEQAKPERKLPVVCLTEHGRQGFGILIWSEDMDEFIQIMNRRPGRPKIGER
jgi:hypothetical protein